MRLLRSLLVAAVLATSGCALFHKKAITTADPNPVIATASSIQTAQGGVMDRLAGYNVAETSVVTTLPPSRVKDAAMEIMEDQLRLTGAPTPDTRSTFESWAIAMISEEQGVIDQAEAKRQTLSDQNDALKGKLSDLQTTQTVQLKELKSEQALQLANAQAEADAKVKSIVSYIFFGLAAICILGAIAVGMLAASYPLFGPKAAMALGAAGITSGAVGVAIIKLMDVSVMYWGIGAIVLLISIALVLVYSNHSHATSSPTK